jgi:hypothetical protein
MRQAKKEGKQTRSQANKKSGEQEVKRSRRTRSAEGIALHNITYIYRYSIIPRAESYLLSSCLSSCSHLALLLFSLPPCPPLPSFASLAFPCLPCLPLPACLFLACLSPPYLLRPPPLACLSLPCSSVSSLPVYLPLACMSPLASLSPPCLPISLLLTLLPHLVSLASPVFQYPPLALLLPCSYLPLPWLPPPISLSLSTRLSSSYEPIFLINAAEHRGTLVLACPPPCWGHRDGGLYRGRL